jgi:uncharacterized protein (TIGR00299 family) protein
LNVIVVDKETESGGKIHRHYEDIIPYIKRVFPDFKDKWKITAEELFAKLARAEAEVHGLDWKKVHFHEVGGVDSLVDILFSLWLLKKMGIERLFYLPPIPNSRAGIIQISHGALPSMAPATAQLLKGKRIILLEEEQEMVTPTGALFFTLMEELTDKMSFTYSSLGYGAGKHILKTRPNFVRIFQGKVFALKDGSSFDNEIVEMSFLVDDMSPQALSILYEVLDVGALDIYITPVVGKKGRPAHYITILSEKFNISKVAEFVFSHTTTAGIRYVYKKRWEQNRELKTLDTRFGPVTIKLFGNTVIPEFEECKKIARKEGIAVYKVIEEVRNSVNRESK